MAKGAYIGVENFTPRTLPSGYTQVEYIESTGTQYINTNYYPKYNTRVVADISGLGTSAGYVFGTRNSSTATAAKQYGIYRNAATTVRSDYFGTNASLSVSDTTGRAKVDKNGNVVTMYGGTVTNTAVSSGECPYPLFLFALNNVGTAAVNGSFKLHYCKIYDNGTLVRDYIPCINASGTVGLYDVVNNAFYANDGTGVFTAGQTLHSVAMKVIGGYIGVNGIARKIKKAYIGIGGVARPCWASGKLTYYGAVTELATKRRNLGAASVGNYALFAGGYRYSSTQAAVEYYSTSLTHGTATSLTQGRDTFASTTVGNYALFGGGGFYNASATYKDVDAYSASLTRSTATALNSAGKYLGATTVGNYALFVGGSGNACDAYNTSLTHSTVSAIGNRNGIGATTVGNYALFAGGLINGATGTYYTSAHSYDASLTLTTATDLSVAKAFTTGGTVGNYAIFAGGQTSGGGCTAKCDAYTSSLTKVTISDLSDSRSGPASTTIGDYAIFAGGNSWGSGSSKVDSYDSSLVKGTQTVLSHARYNLGAATVGNYALFGGGGYNYADNSKVDRGEVDAYTVI